ncbi:TPA: phage protein Gp27 family protein, partial [Serratia marcescens]
MADEKPTRGRPSKIDLLPENIRDALHQMLRDKRHTQEEIREAINTLIDQHELPDDMQLSRTGLNRYASRMEAIGSKIRASREMAEIWAAK